MTQIQAVTTLWLYGEWFGFAKSDAKQITALCKVCRKPVKTANCSTTNSTQHLKQKHAWKWETISTAKNQQTLAASFSVTTFSNMIAGNAVLIYTAGTQGLEKMLNKHVWTVKLGVFLLRKRCPPSVQWNERKLRSSWCCITQQQQISQPEEPCSLTWTRPPIALTRTVSGAVLMPLTFCYSSAQHRHSIIEEECSLEVVLHVCLQTLWWKKVYYNTVYVLYGILYISYF